MSVQTERRSLANSQIHRRAMASALQAVMSALADAALGFPRSRDEHVNAIVRLISSVPAGSAEPKIVAEDTGRLGRLTSETKSYIDAVINHRYDLLTTRDTLQRPARRPQISSRAENKLRPTTQILSLQSDSKSFQTAESKVQPISSSATLEANAAAGAAAAVAASAPDQFTSLNPCELETKHAALLVKGTETEIQRQIDESGSDVCNFMKSKIDTIIPNFNDYSPRKMIGKGAYGAILYLQNTRNPSDVRVLKISFIGEKFRTAESTSYLRSSLRLSRPVIEIDREGDFMQYAQLKILSSQQPISVHIPDLLDTRIAEFDTDIRIGLTAMSYVRGLPLYYYVMKIPAASPDAIVHIGQQIGTQLSAIHDLGIAHGDFHSLNIMVNDSVDPVEISIIDWARIHMRSSFGSTGDEAKKWACVCIFDLYLFYKNLRSYFDRYDNAREVVKHVCEAYTSTKSGRTRFRFVSQQLRGDPDLMNYFETLRGSGYPAQFYKSHVLAAMTIDRAGGTRGTLQKNSDELRRIAHNIISQNERLQKINTCDYS